MSHAVLKTVPTSVFFAVAHAAQEFIGGCDETKKLQSTGELARRLRAAGMAFKKPTTITVQADPANSASAHSAAKQGHKMGGVHGANVKNIADSAFVEEEGVKVGGALFHFPEVMDNRMQRLGSFWVSIQAIIF